jgi:hypothetical protein
MMIIACECPCTIDPSNLQASFKENALRKLR